MITDALRFTYLKNTAHSIVWAISIFFKPVVHIFAISGFVVFIVKQENLL